jgi:DNA polymerase elongation subunit (family B)
MFYTNVAQMGNSIMFLGYHNGKRVKKQIPYKPKLFVSSRGKSPTKYKTLNGQEVDEIDFDSIKDAKEFVDRYSDVANFSIYGFNRWKYTFIADLFKGDINYDLERINVLYIDIETEMPKSGFENYVEDAPMPVTAISIRMRDRRICFAYKEDYIPKDDKTSYVKCSDEYELLQRFIEVYCSEDWSPDVISGWNVEFFDIPYLVNRIRSKLGHDQAKRLSPWGILHERSVYSFGRDQQAYVPVGVSILDYLNLYKKFTYNQQESYKLDHISHVELGEKKVDYSDYQNLDDLYENDFEKFMDYNIHDTDLVYKLDQKLKLMDLIFIMSYDAKINFNDSLGSVLPWEVVIYNYLKEHNIVMPFKSSHQKDEAYEGAFVKQPIPGMYDWVTSFDLTSLYPHLIIQYNISPETKVSKRGDVTVDGILDGRVTNDSEYSMAANGCLYRKDGQGFLPALMERFFAKRKMYKNQMIQFKKRKEMGEKGVDNEIARLDNAQMAMKIFLNSAYGAVGNKYFTFYDSDNAEAITLSGQLSIRWAERRVNNFLNEKMETNDVDYIIAMDTDSMYLNLGPLVSKYSGSNIDGTGSGSSPDDLNRITDIIDRLCDKAIQPQIEQGYKELADLMNAYVQAMDMKREAISNRGIWKAKKMYVLNVIDNEGVRYKEPDLKIMGLEAIRSSIPEECRIALKQSLKIILNQTNDNLVDFISNFRKKFDSLPFADIAFPRSVKGLEKYRDHQTLYTKGTPIHVKGALQYNELLKKHKLSMNPIYDGDKIKFAYLKQPNPLHDTVIACPGYLPKEFKLDEYVDRQKQFEKAYLDPLKSITDIIEWKTDKSINIEDFF